jgi:hypothetical protein
MWVKSLAKKLKQASVKTKRINWDKYVGKIKLPDPVDYQQKMRDDWK